MWIIKYVKSIGAIDMKRPSKIIILLLGGLLIMIGLSACGEKIPENRTKEQYELEKEFQPLFDFLAEEEKDLSNVKLYSSKIFMMDENANSKISSSVYLKPDNTGEYAIEQGGQTTEFLVHYNNRKLQYNKEVPQEYDLEVFNLKLEPKFFQELSIFDYMTKYSGTGMKRIDYNIVDASKYFNNLKEKYGLKKDCSTSVDVIINSEGHFELILEFSDEERLLVITNSIVIDME
ncbi:hypothetical protein HMPREF9389_1106 [Streptococcus sanguinis SK355]|uniref:Uncharacterized protein n=2 Tax=Streptococcus sanguinis TaxID=1305 RepID=F3UQD9_STRSA|nr:hypothetical protein HMPREF9389_1106 [Streptococcus sanguinis SK355]